LGDELCACGGFGGVQWRLRRRGAAASDSAIDAVVVVEVAEDEDDGGPEQSRESPSSVLGRMWRIEKAYASSAGDDKRWRAVGEGGITGGWRAHGGVRTTGRWGERRASVCPGCVMDVCL
jgi:hypothetical protein